MWRWSHEGRTLDGLKHQLESQTYPYILSALSRCPENWEWLCSSVGFILNIHRDKRKPAALPQSHCPPAVIWWLGFLPGFICLQTSSWPWCSTAVAIVTLLCLLQESGRNVAGKRLNVILIISSGKYTPVYRYTHTGRQILLNTLFVRCVCVYLLTNALC